LRQRYHNLENTKALDPVAIMAPQWSLRLAVLALLSLNVNQVSALNIQYCSDVNTAGGSGSKQPPNSWELHILTN
jgi:hypothetical protein